MRRLFEFDLLTIGTLVLLGLLVVSAIQATDFPQDRHTNQASEWFFQEQAANDALRGKTIKRIWATGSKLVIECDGATFEYSPEIAGKVQLLPRGKIIRP